MDAQRASGPAVEEEERVLRRILGELGREAAKRRFEVAPNPSVGAALVRGGDVLARGFHEHWGGPHAEVNALASARAAGLHASADDALVVTLEPCSSAGKQPPCTEAILAAGLRRVVAGEVDPDPRHRGAGLVLLRDRGLEVELLSGPARLAEVAPHFLRWTEPDRLRRPRPWTIAKWAQTRTGQLSPPLEVGDGRWISGSAARDEVHLLRGRVDALLTGVGTVLADDPRLSVRAPGDPARPPLRVVLDTTLRTPPGARLFGAPRDGEGAGAVVILCRPGAAPARHRALEAAGARVVTIRSGDDGRPMLWEVARWLFDQGVRRLLLEAGPTLMAAWFRADLVDQVRVYTGDVNGGRGAPLAEWLERRRLEGTEIGEIGGDSRLEGFVKR